MIRVENLVKHFGEVQALRGVTTTFESGATSVIVGPSGSGKSTLLRSLNLLEEPDSGSLTVGGTTLTFPDHAPRAARLAVTNASTMVFQSFNLFPHLSVLDNVALPLELERKRATKAQGSGSDGGDAGARSGAAQRANAGERAGAVSSSGAGAEANEDPKTVAREFLERVGLEAKQDAYPSQLSGGQQQRVAIARALALRPDYLLCDEPTSALDPELAAGVSRVLADVAESGQPIIIVTHDMRFAQRVADKLAFLEDGQIQYDGDPEGFFGSSDARIREFLAAFEI